jgi:hypothetical protein
VRLVCSALAALALASSSWQVRVSEGIAGVRLGMTRAQAAAQVGKPYAMSLPSAHATCGLYARHQDFNACFDLRTGRVVSVSAIGPKYCVVRPRFCFQRVGGLAKLKHAFGRRLIGPVWREDELFYEVVVRHEGRRVQSAFVIDTQGAPPFRGSAVVAVYISLCGRQGKIVPPCPKRQ